MSFASGCLIAIGVVFVLFGGCTTLFWGAEFAGPDPGFGSDAGFLLMVGLAILAGGVGMIVAAVGAIRRRRRAPPIVTRD